MILLGVCHQPKVSETDSLGETKHLRFKPGLEEVNCKMHSAVFWVNQGGGHVKINQECYSRHRLIRIIHTFYIDNCRIFFNLSKGATQGLTALIQSNSYHTTFEILLQAN